MIGNYSVITLCGSTRFKDQFLEAQKRLTLECKVVSWEDGILVGEVVNMSADESILTDGKVDLERLQPIVFDASGMCYRSICDVVGGAWAAGKKFSE